MATDRQTPCLFYICAGLCKKGRKADHAHYCQQETDEWLRHKIRAVYWKQWKKVKTRYRMIKKYGLPKWKVHEMANCRKGTWRSALMLNSVLTKHEIASLGYISMTDYYLKVCEN